MPQERAPAVAGTVRVERRALAIDSFELIDGIAYAGEPVGLEHQIDAAYDREALPDELAHLGLQVETGAPPVRVQGGLHLRERAHAREKAQAQRRRRDHVGRARGLEPLVAEEERARTPASLVARPAGAGHPGDEHRARDGAHPPMVVDDAANDALHPAHAVAVILLLWAEAQASRARARIQRLANALFPAHPHPLPRRESGDLSCARERRGPGVVWPEERTSDGESLVEAAARTLKEGALADAITPLATGGVDHDRRSFASCVPPSRGHGGEGHVRCTAPPHDPHPRCR